jgi:hypothetical protein
MITPEIPSNDRLAQLAHEVLVRLESHPVPHRPAEVIAHLWNIAAAHTLLGMHHVDNARVALEESFGAWTQCTASSATFQQAFAWSANIAQASEEAFFLRGVVRQGVQAMIAAERFQLLEQLEQCWIRLFQATTETTDDPFTAEVVEARQLLLIWRGKLDVANRERSENWLNWLDDELVDEDDPVWSGTKALIDNNGIRLRQALEHLAQNRQRLLAALAAGQPVLRHPMTAAAILGIPTVALVRLANRQAMAQQSSDAFLDANILTLWRI